MQELQDLELALKPAGEEIVRDGWGRFLKSRLLADALAVWLYRADMQLVSPDVQCLGGWTA